MFCLFIEVLQALLMGSAVKCVLLENLSAIQKYEYFKRLVAVKNDEEFENSRIFNYKLCSPFF